MTDSPNPPQASQPTSEHQRPARKTGTRPVHPVLQKLFELYPGLFGGRFVPLKLGIFQDLLAKHPEAFKRQDLKVALGLHARSTRYLEAVASGQPRHDLQGLAGEPVAPEHVHHAVMEVFRRRQARSAEDLRPYVVAQLVAAIEASGLRRDAYAQRMRTQDETSNALLDQAVAQLAQQAARGEALLRAFEASGRTVPEFAEMYGMDPSEAQQTLDRARNDKSKPGDAAGEAPGP
jgi:ProP effector